MVAAGELPNTDDCGRRTAEHHGLELGVVGTMVDARAGDREVLKLCAEVCHYVLPVFGIGGVSEEAPAPDGIGHHEIVGEILYGRGIGGRKVTRDIEVHGIILGMLLIIEAGARLDRNFDLLAESAKNHAPGRVEVALNLLEVAIGGGVDELLGKVVGGGRFAAVNGGKGWGITDDEGGVADVLDKLRIQDNDFELGEFVLFFTCKHDL